MRKCGVSIVVQVKAGSSLAMAREAWSRITMAKTRIFFNNMLREKRIFSGTQNKIIASEVMKSRELSREGFGTRSRQPPSLFPVMQRAPDRQPHSERLRGPFDGPVLLRSMGHPRKHQLPALHDNVEHGDEEGGIRGNARLD